jgi:hypothetical protein
MSITEEAAMDHDDKAKEVHGQSGHGKSRPDPARRAFLKAAPLGALAVVAGQPGAAAAAPVAPVPEVPAAPRGYHETEHIRRYYQTAAYW